MRVDCPEEIAVTRAARTGERDEAIQSHLAACAACREVVHVSRSLEALAHDAEGVAALQEAGLVWWKAQLMQRQKQAERAQRSVAWIEIAVGSVALLVLAGGFTWEWLRFQDRLTDILAGHWPSVWNVAQAATDSALGSDASTFWPLLAVICCVVVSVGYPYLIEE